MDKNDLEYWTWCESLTIMQAALLCVGVSPDSNDGVNCEGWSIQERPRGYEAVKSAIFAACISGIIICNNETYFDFREEHINIPKSTVNVESLKKWLKSTGKRSRFFLPEQSNTPDYLDTNHPRYSPKLAAAIKVWLALGDENLRVGKSAKAAAIAWLESRYSELGLVYDGKINNKAINEIATIVNHETGGGAPTTPN